MNFRYRLNRFMYGRYGGNDTLNKALIALLFIVVIINAFIHSIITELSVLALCVVIIFRMLSKNIFKRQSENQKFMILWSKAQPSFSRLKRRLADRNTHRYRKCKNCKTVLRLPKKTGKHSVVCPKCKNRFDVHIWF